MVRSITFLEAGYTEQLEKFVNPLTGSWRKIRFPSTVAVIEHATAGMILFDTGYSPRFAEVTRYFPEKIYALITPVVIPPEESAAGKLKQLGLRPDDVSHVVLSHFHADHIAGAAEFKKAKYVYSFRELEYFKGLSRFNQVKNAFVGALLPDDLNSRSLPADEFLVPLPELGPSWIGKDLLGDGSIMLVSLPGHTLGQVGLYIRDVGGKDYLLVADAAWLTTSYQENILPHQVAQSVFYNKKAYRETLGHLHDLYCTHQSGGRLNIVTCHCDMGFSEIEGKHV
jgi:glyoxylase-like metal-dependent hydrolase (beta-lactamase superfamily II)